jgi:hypothetical protein
MSEGYWRSSQNSDKIMYCIKAPVNCIGGTLSGNDTCLANRIGPLCEECDMGKNYILNNSLH